MANLLVSESNLSLIASKGLIGGTLPDNRSAKMACQQLDQFVSGAISSESLDMWLTAGACVYTPRQLMILINRQKCFSVDEMTAMVADKRGRYYPALSTSEIAEMKLFKRIPVYSKDEIKEKVILNNVISEMLSRKFGLSMSPQDTAALGASGGKIDWMAATPSMLGTAGGNQYLFDFNILKSGEDNAVDNDILQTRLHYLDLVANNHGQKPNEVIMATCKINEDLTNILKVMVRMPGFNQQMLVEALGSSTALEQCFQLELERIVRSPTVYGEIIEAGGNLKQMIVAGKVPEPPKEIEIQLDQPLRQEYTKLAQDTYGAMQARYAAESIEAEMKAKMTAFCSLHRITKDFKPPYGGVHMRSHDKFDAESADKYLVEVVGVDQSHTRTPEINIETLAADYVRMGGDISKHTTHGGPNRRAIEEVASKAGIPIEQFYDRKMEAVVPPKTRGDFFEVTQEFRGELKEKFGEMLKDADVRRFIEHPTIADGGIQKRKSLNGPGM